MSGDVIAACDAKVHPIDVTIPLPQFTDLDNNAFQSDR